ncbi:MAG TPA: S8 family serine peptidase [Blastocatellia bacterium]|nr:S8 family serine peptidase [Blastocatellia bacterium]
MTCRFKRSRHVVFILAAFAILGSTAVPQQSVPPSPPLPYVEGELLIKVNDNSESIRESRELMHAATLESYPAIGWQRVKLPEGVSVAEAIESYRRLGGVIAAQPNFIYRIAVAPNDASFGSLYGMARIQAPAAWDSITGSPSVVVAILDTGIRHTHEDLAANVWHNPGEIPGNGIDDDGNGFVDDAIGYDFINNDSDPLDDGGHGTHVSGTAGAVGNNALGVAGVNWNVKIMALKTHDSGGNSTSATVIRAFNYVAMMKNRGVNIRVTSNSWGGPPEAPAYDQALKDAIDATGNAGVLNVFAAGNSASDNDAVPSYPDSYNSPSIISVASSNDKDDRSPFSNFGAKSVDLAAPGSNILSTYNANDSSYRALSGTSMSTPHVAGAVALLAAYNPALSAQSLKATILNTVDVLPQWSGLVLTGGRLNVARALQNQTVCAYSVETVSTHFLASGGLGTINVSSPTNCGWMITGKPDWITVTSESAGSGDGTVSFSIAPNSISAPRQATLNIAGRSVTISQEAGVDASCSYKATPSSKKFKADGGSGTINIKAESRCGWQATTDASWISFTSTATGSGTSTVTFSVAPNTSGGSRKANISIGGVTIRIKQKGG